MPYFLRNVERSIENCRASLEEIEKSKWNRMERAFISNCKDLEGWFNSIEWDLDDMHETIVIVSKNQQRFGISDSELNERHHFLNTSRKSIASMRETLLKIQSDLINGFHKVLALF